jgi:hypothetical protein
MVGKPKGPRPAMIVIAKPEESQSVHKHVKFLDIKIPRHLPLYALIIKLGKISEIICIAKLTFCEGIFKTILGPRLFNLW